MKILNPGSSPPCSLLSSTFRQRYIYLLELFLGAEHRIALFAVLTKITFKAVGDVFRFWSVGLVAYRYPRRHPGYPTLAQNEVLHGRGGLAWEPSNGDYPRSEFYWYDYRLFCAIWHFSNSGQRQ